MQKIQDYAAILLAAGKSSRLKKDGIGIPKPLLLAGGGTFLSRAVRNCEGICFPIVVIGHNADLLVNSCQSLGVSYCVNENFEKGQTSSLKTGIRNLAATVKAFFVYPVDYPNVRKETVQLLVRAFESSGKKIVLPVHENQGGHPLLVSIDFKNDFLSLGDDEPANLIIRAHRDDVLRLPVDDPGILFDVDTRAELERIL